MRLYHGSYMAVSQPNIQYSRKNLDFGQGFYLAKDYDQAVNWAKRYRYKNLPCIVNVYILDIERIQQQYNVKVFDSYDKEWLHYIIQNREGELTEKYDVVIGGIANDKVFNTIELFQSGLINEEETLGRLKYEKPNWQMCICSQEILDLHLKYHGNEVTMCESK